MKLLIQRGRQAVSSLPRPIFTLRVRAELLEDEESLLEKYKIGNALLYEGNRKEQIETAFGIAVTSCIASAVFLYITGFRVWAAAVTDTACPGICTNPWCEYVATVPPSEQAGYCPRDGNDTVQSAVVLAGLA